MDDVTEHQAARRNRWEGRDDNAMRRWLATVQSTTWWTTMSEELTAIDGC